MSPIVDVQAVWNFATALLIGALLGIERERHKRGHDDVAIGGLRTFILFALIGAGVLFGAGVGAATFLGLGKSHAEVEVDPLRPMLVERIDRAPRRQA